MLKTGAVLVRVMLEVSALNVIPAVVVPRSSPEFPVISTELLPRLSVLVFVLLDNNPMQVTL